MHVEASHPGLALPLYQEALDILTAALPAGHPDISEASRCTHTPAPPAAQAPISIPIRATLTNPKTLSTGPTT